MAERASGWSCWMLALLLAGCGREDASAVDMAGVRLGQVLGGDPAEFARASVVRPFEFPGDHGPHPEFRSEWWYVTAVLVDADGHDFGVHFTLFRQALAGPGSRRGTNPWSDLQAYLAHCALTDVERQAHHSASRFARAHPAAAGVDTQPRFRAFIEDWSMNETSAEPWRLALQCSERDTFAASLTFEQTVAPLLQGQDGLSHKGPDAASYYYSVPRLQTRGRLTIEGRTVDVTGWAWLDREWSTSVLGGHLIGWDWFALQLYDGRSLMAYRLRRVDGTRDPYDHGVMLTSSGTRTLTPDDFELLPLRSWRDADGVAWPVEWALRVGKEQMRVSALVDDQLVRHGLVYWEGIVGVVSQERDAGRGYMELTGYR